MKKVIIKPIEAEETINIEDINITGNRGGIFYTNKGKGHIVCLLSNLKYNAISLSEGNRWDDDKDTAKEIITKSPSPLKNIYYYESQKELAELILKYCRDK